MHSIDADSYKKAIGITVALNSRCAFGLEHFLLCAVGREFTEEQKTAWLELVLVGQCIAEQVTCS